MVGRFLAGTDIVPRCSSASERRKMSTGRGKRLRSGAEMPTRGFRGAKDT